MSPQQWYRPSRCNTVYLCIIAADGTFQVGPEGWTVTRVGLGVYTITHNLGHLRYCLIPTIMDATYRSTGTIQAHTEHDLTVAVANNGAAADSPFQLLVMTTQ